MKKFVTFVKSLNWEGHYMALMLIALALTVTLIVENSKRQDAEIQRQRAVEMLEIERDARYNDSLVN